MKRTLIILDSLLIALVLVLGFALFRSVQNQRNEVSISSYQQQVNPHEDSVTDLRNTELEGLSIDVNQVKNGEFSTLSGLWKNLPESNEPIELLISGFSATMDNIQYELVLGGMERYNNLPYLELKKSDVLSNLSLGIYPRGTYIPVLLADGTIEQSGEHDPTNNERDRIIVGRGALLVEDTKHQVLYREMEEVA